MPPIYAIISFLSYRFFRSYTYYEFAEVGMSLVRFVFLIKSLMFVFSSLRGDFYNFLYSG